MSGSDRISPTAHYTAHVWYRAGLAPAALATAEGRVLFDALNPAMALGARLGLPTLEPYLLARHRALDRLLEEELARSGTTQVLELAAGLSARGWRFTRRCGRSLVYVEADLPAMAARKRAALARARESVPEAQGQGGPARSPGDAPAPRVEAVDVLRPAGRGSLEELIDGLDPDRGLIVITEGLLSYLPRPEVDRLWRRLAALLEPFRAGVYLADVHLATDESSVVAGFRRALGLFVRGQVRTHFADREALLDALRSAGFPAPRVWRAADLAKPPAPHPGAERNPAAQPPAAVAAKGGGGVGPPIPGHVLEASMNLLP